MPVHVNGRLWGAIAVGSGQAPLPPDAEQRMAEFTDLVATAVANAQNWAALEASRDELARLLTEQAALRRVATLVARGIDPAEVFAAVAEELRLLLDADHAGIGRFEPDGTAVVVVGGVGDDPLTLPVGTRVELRDYLPPAAVWRTGCLCPGRRYGRMEQCAGPGCRRPAHAGHPVGRGQPDHRRWPPVGSGECVVEATAVSSRHGRPPSGLH